ncbi:hypothetical protein BaRGS_00004925 [Batillaria attramentaria]|uniref:Uncharacterized protein n=1 Tax=Batillaria attramentaria TaxID=370345 RepID=A0ABD0LXX2_9CAEN
MSHPRVLLDDEACDRGPTNTDPVDKLHTAPSCGGSVLSHSTVLAAAWHSGSQTIGVWSRKLSGVVLKSKVQTSNAIMSRDFFRSQPSGQNRYERPAHQNTDHTTSRQPRQRLDTHHPQHRSPPSQHHYFHLPRVGRQQDTVRVIGPPESRL